MLGRLNRFHGHGSVRRAYRLGKPVRSSLATMHVVQNDKLRRSKVAVVVSRKVDKSAVKRNRIRRRIYEIARHKLPDIKSPAEIVITVYQVEAATMPADELQKSIATLFKKANL